MVIFKRFLLLFFWVHSLSWNVEAAAARDGGNGAGRKTYTPVHIGVVLDLNSTMGAMADVCISIALEDFYSAHSDYRTKLSIHMKDAREEFDVASEVLGLLKTEEVNGILGPQRLTEDTFATELGRKVQVPIISFTSRTQSLSHGRNPYFIRTTPNSNQVKALAAICKGFEWHEAVILYEDSEYGSQFASVLNREFLREDIRFAYMLAISESAANHHIKEELANLSTIQTRVFIVHMNAILGSRLFFLAKRAGLMTEGYAWLITDSIGNFLNSMDSTTLESMEGVLGIRPHVPKSEELERFKERWKKKMILTKSASTRSELNVYGLWAYDTVWALAMAVEKIGPVNSSFLKVTNAENGSYIANLGLSQYGPELLRELQNTTFIGLSGKFQLLNGQLKSPALEIYNVIETGGRTIGYWTPDRGITGKLISTGDSKTYSTSTKELKTILWPGDSVKKPMGWSIPSTRKLKVAFPGKSGFTEFIHAITDPETKQIKPAGFCIDIFLSTLQYLPFEVEPEYISFDPDGIPYTDFVNSLPDKDFSIMVGDTTILAERAKSVDFSLPYSDSGVVWVVKNKQEKNMWIFIKPFRWDLWVTILATCTFIGVVLRIMEHQVNQNSDTLRPTRQQLGMLFWFPIAVLAFPERNMVANNWSRFVLVVWLFMSYILMQSYTANLSAMFTVDQLDFRFSQDYVIGYQTGSFVKDYLKDRLHIKGSKLRNYSSIEEYDEAMTLGGKMGGIDAIVDEIPYMKLLINRYGSKYKMLEQRYRTDGFGFAFPKNSPLVVYFSRAILEVTESPNMTYIEEKNFGPGYSPDNQLDSISEQNRLTAYNFGGLFIIIASAMIFALFCSVPSLGPKLVGSATNYSLKCFTFLHSGGNLRTNSMVYPEESKDATTEHEVQMSEQIACNNSALPDRDHQSGQWSSDVSAEGNEVDQNNDSNEILQPELGNIHVTLTR